MENVTPAIVEELSTNLEIDLHGKKTIEELKLAMSNYINYLIGHDVNKLMRILFKVDVSEKTLRKHLTDADKDVGVVIADLLVDRQLEKMESKKQFKPDKDIPENEKW